MKRNVGVYACSTVLLVTSFLFAQSSPEDLRVAFRAWRDAEPNLELDASTAGAALAPRTIRAAEQEAKYGAARSVALRQLAGQYDPSAQSLKPELLPTASSPAPAAQLQRYVTTQTSLVGATITAFAKDSDAGIRPLQQALERERSALTALNTAIGDRQKAEDKATLTMNVAAQRRNSASEQYQKVLAAIGGSADSIDRESTAWAAYYQKLADAALAVNPAIPAPSAPVLSTTLTPAEPPSPPLTRPPSITPLPLARYTGAWTYSTAGGMFHGAEPEFVDVVVREDNGKATGTFYARFKLPSGSTGDPVVRFDFSGDFRPTRNQTFALETDDGAKGTIELIPGNAFNLLEMNFETELRPGKIHLGDLLLVKK